jgi:hypothetical protein
MGRDAETSPRTKVAKCGSGPAVVEVVAAPIVAGNVSVLTRRPRHAVQSTVNGLRRSAPIPRWAETMECREPLQAESLVASGSACSVERKAGPTLSTDDPP